MVIVIADGLLQDGVGGEVLVCLVHGLGQCQLIPHAVGLRPGGPDLMLNAVEEMEGPLWPPGGGRLGSCRGWGWIEEGVGTGQQRRSLGVAAAAGYQHQHNDERCNENEASSHASFW